MGAKVTASLNSTPRRHFADRKVDVAVVETGMGGTTDATNVFDASSLAAAVITPLGELCPCGELILMVQHPGFQSKISFRQGSRK